jgi:hypothetical protein
MSETKVITQKITGFRVVEEQFEHPPVKEVKKTPKELKSPPILEGRRYKIKSPMTKSAMYVMIFDIVNEEDGTRQPFEIFINSKDTTHFEWITALTRMISACFRRGGDLSFILEELECIIAPGHPGYIAKGGRHIPSLVAEISLCAIREHFKHLGLIDVPKHDDFVVEYLDGKKAEYMEKTGDKVDDHTGFPKNAVVCPKCQVKAMVPMDNCMTCLACGDSKCG